MFLFLAVYCEKVMSLLCGSFEFGFATVHSIYFLLKSRLDKNLNSSWPFGQAALRFLLPE